MTAKDYDLIVIFGECGAGKSSLMLHFIDEYVNNKAADRLQLSEQLIRDENVDRDRMLSYPSKIPIYSNLDFNIPINNRVIKPIKIKGKDVGISNDEEKYKYFFPASLFAFDEAHNEFVSKGENLPGGQRDFFYKRRHNRLKILLATPRAVLIHKDIRNSGAHFIEVLSSVNTKNPFGTVCRTVWHCREYDKTGIEQYIATNGASGDYTETEYTHKGNVFDLYDSFAFKKDFMPPEGGDFYE